MPAAITDNETLQLTLSLPPDVAKNIRAQVQSGDYTSESHYIESVLLSDTLFKPIDQDELTHWMATEGVRRIEALKANPASGLSLDEAFAGLIDEDEVDDDA